MQMKKYIVRVNCPGFADIEVEAENKEEAIQKAENEFKCDCVGGEFCSIKEVKN